MAKYKIVHSFTLRNKYFLKRLEKYSEEGWHFNKWLLFFILLKRGEPKKYKYSLVYDKKFSKDRKIFYETAGWKVVRNSFFWQILRGEPNAVELYTDNLSEEEMWKYRIRFTGILFLFFTIIDLFLLIFSTRIKNNILEFLCGGFFGATVGFIIINIYFYIKYNIVKKRRSEYE
ncbi:DUF2812 domain-containing protein [Gemella cuniculi]|uniref:DUF2812 domain-containing protein n=1 Tax=Gemella cuniculi TaxID=150240 RepID=UPI0003F92AA4|nr:DUF2812 domain-containing protein [Gemella cuniculi]